jgi:mono/diheme cytochrome c family protein
MSGLQLGRKVFDIRCGICHPIGGPGDKTSSLTGLLPQDYNDILDMSEYLGEGMPPFTGDETERSALVRFLSSRGEAP